MVDLIESWELCCKIWLAKNVSKRLISIIYAHASGSMVKNNNTTAF